MNIAIVGAGRLGTTLAQITILAGHAVAIYDVNPQATQQSILEIAQTLEQQVQAGALDYQNAARARALLGSTTILEHCGQAEVVIECAPEQLDVKKMILERLDKVAPATIPLATTSATLSISVIASAAHKHPERVLGLHFFDPQGPLVEIIRADHTSPSSIDQILSVLRELGKDGVTVRDQPAFLVNRLLNIYSGEALKIMAEQHLPPESIDRLMGSLGVQNPPCRYLDQVGLDADLETKTFLYNATFQEARYRPHPLQQKMVQLGHLGRKSGRGFYPYADAE
jgi:3-hydroxybutyryl-CoA dehydrogenase